MQPGTHTLEISGRSEDAYIDRIHLSLDTLNTDKSLPETLATAQDKDDPVPDVQNGDPIVVATEFTTMEDGQLVISVNQIASDPDGDPLSVAIFAQPDNGTLALQNGQLVYRPAADFSGTDSADIEVSDGAGGTTSVQLEFVVDPVNDAPNAEDDAGGEVAAGEAFMLDDILSNDTDPDGDELAVSEVEASTDGIFEDLQIDADGRILGVLAGNAEGTGFIRYMVSDGHSGTDTATISIAALAAEVPDTPDQPDTLDDPDALDAPPSGNDGDLIRAINIGSKIAYTAADGTVFAADITGVGRSYTSQGPVGDTEDDVLYEKEAWSPNGLSYDFDVENGAYAVDLHFAEIWNPAFEEGVRVSDVEVEGSLLADDLDIYAEVGERAAHVLRTEVNVTDGVLGIDLSKGVQNPKLSAIKIRSIAEEDRGTPEDGDVSQDPVALPEDDGSILSLVDTDTDETIAFLADRTVIHEGLIADRNILVSAEVDENKIEAESAKMTLDGAFVQTENVEPYALFGDIERDYKGHLDIALGEERQIGVEYFEKITAKAPHSRKTVVC